MAHLLGSVLALEKALGVEVSEDVSRLRRAVEAVGIVQNDLVHVLMALPDYLGYGSLAELARSEEALLRSFIEVNTEVLRAYGSIAGRFTHTHTIDVAYQGKLVTKYDLERASRALARVAKGIEGLMAKLAARWRSMELVDPSPNYITVSSPGYPVLGERIVTSDGETVEALRYGDVIHEEEVEYSNAKHCTYRGRPFFVGPRARLSRSYGNVLKTLGDRAGLLQLDLGNPFDNVKAQLVEALHLALTVRDELAELAASVGGGLKLYDPSRLRGSGEAASAVEAPRGLLIHHYRVRDGRVTAANIITPTTMNCKHMELCCEALANRLREQGARPEEVKLRIEALIRSYDPCLPCAVH